MRINGPSLWAPALDAERKREGPAGGNSSGSGAGRHHGPSGETSLGSTQYAPEQDGHRNPLAVIGTDAAGLAGLPARSLNLVRAAALLVAPQRLLVEVELWWRQEHEAGRIPPEQPCPQRLASDRPEQCFAPLEETLAAGHPAVLLASGDPLWFGIGRLLLLQFGPERLRFHPAPSSLQLAFARIGRPWQDAGWISLHGREPEALASRLQQRPAALAVLTDPGRGGVAEVRRLLRASGLEAAYQLWLCERLGHPAERVLPLAPDAPLPADLDPLHLAVLIAQPPPLPDPAALPNNHLAYAGQWFFFALTALMIYVVALRRRSTRARPD